MEVTNYFLVTVLFSFLAFAESNDCEVGCYSNNTLYKLGEHFSDGCNKCQCHKDGPICGRMLCGTASQKIEMGCFCESFYSDGETFGHSDGCNHCTCSMGGPMCSRMMCGHKSTEKQESTTHNTIKELPVVSPCEKDLLYCSTGQCVTYDELCKNRAGVTCDRQDHDAFCGSSSVVASVSVAVALLVVQFFSARQTL